jgi:hypothetical protein
MSKKLAKERMWAVTRKKIALQKETRELLDSSVLIHKYLIEHPLPDFDLPDFIYVPWVAAIKKLGGNV